MKAACAAFIEFLLYLRVEGILRPEPRHARRVQRCTTSVPCPRMPGTPITEVKEELVVAVQATTAEDME
jgi:hypothetical protein